jgi:hypothetical protein
MNQCRRCRRDLTADVISQAEPTTCLPCQREVAAMDRRRAQLRLLRTGIVEWDRDGFSKCGRFWIQPLTNHAVKPWSFRLHDIEFDGGGVIKNGRGSFTNQRAAKEIAQFVVTSERQLAAKEVK